MIQQHFLQQQRLNHNHERLLERYHQLLPPKMTEFRTFGTSALPGRNYDQYLGKLHGGKSVIAQSRAGIGSSSETYRFMDNRATEMLPRNVKSIMQHSRSQSARLVHAEKFEPVQVYEHPRFGPTPSYIRPIINERQHEDDPDEHYSDSDEEDEAEVSSKAEQKDETKSESTEIKNDDNEEPDLAPRGYISYKKWKTKYENLIPVNPLLFSIYTRRPNGSINKYGQSLYASPPRHRRASLDEDAFTPTSSEIESITSETPRDTSLASKQRYNRLQQQTRLQPITPRRLEPIRTEDESSDDESSPPESPVPYLSRTKINPLSSTPIIPTTRPITPPLSTLDTLDNSATGLSIGVGDDSKNTPSIPPAPPMPPSLAATTTTSTSRYETPSSVPITSPPPAPPMPSFLTTSNSAGSQQVPSSASVPPPAAPSVAESATKAVTFAGISSTPAAQDDVSSSSDSDDEEKQKRRRRKKRQAAGGGDDSSSSDD